MMADYTLALPSKGAIADPTYSFLKDAGLRVSKPNSRQYTGHISGIDGLSVLFQRVKDVVYKVADGTAQIGITGLDVVEEYGSSEVMVVHPKLGYGHCSLIVAVPEVWVDVETVADLVDIASDFREEKGRNLRVATTYTQSTRRFFHAQGIHHFTLVKAEGAIEAAPTIGYADIVVDLTQTGTTLRENHLRPLPDGTIIESQACLIANRRILQQEPDLLDKLRAILEHIDAAITGKSYSQLTVNIKGKTAKDIGNQVAANAVTAGLLGPTVAPVFNPHENEQWYTVTITVPKRDLLAAVDYLRTIGGTQIITQPVDYIFREHSATYQELLANLGQVEEVT